MKRRAIKEESVRVKPYIGLRPFHENDSAFFFGRKRAEDIISANLRSSRLTIIFGASGVGKSSLLRAGVAHKLRQRAREDLSEDGRPKFIVAFFDNWRDDPVVDLANCVREAVSKGLDEQMAEWMPKPGPLTESLRDCAEHLGGDLLIILDQFEQYVLSRAGDNGNNGFAAEFARILKSPDLRVNFLIGIHDSAYSKLQSFKDGVLNIHNIFDNCMELDHLDRQAAREAIEKPIEKYNLFYAAGQQQVTFGPGLVEEVLKGPSADEIVGNGTGDSAGKAEAAMKIETTFLQLVMTKLWEKEVLLGSTALTLETLNGLGGTKKIFEDHVEDVMNKLSGGEQRAAVAVFRDLVRQSGHKISLTASDLADAAKLDHKRIVELLKRLSVERILRSVSPADRDGEPRYEIFHDVLAKPLLEWRTRAEVKAKTAKVRRWLAIALVVMSLLTAVGFSLARIQRARLQAENAMVQAREARLREAAAGNVNSQILAQLYRTILESDDDPRKAADKLQAILPTLNTMLEVDRQLGNSAGEGITLNNIAGYYRFIGRSYAGIEDHDNAQNYYEQSKGYYRKALDILESALGPNHTDIATSLTGLAVIHTNQGNYAEAEPLFKRSLTILENTLGPEDTYLADAIMNLAECYNSQGRYDEAAPLYKRALEIRKEKLGDDAPKFADTLYCLARLSFERGKYAEAEPLFQQALAIWQRDPQSSRDTAVSLNSLSALYREWGKYVKAEKYSNQARKSYADSIYDRDNISFAYHLEDVALLHDKQGIANAEQFYEVALHTWENGLGKDHPTVAYGRSNLASYYFRNGRQSEAEDFFNKALEIQKALPYSPHLAQTSYGLARLYGGQGYYDKAEPLFKQALAIQEKAIPEHPDFADTLAAYADLLGKTDRNAAAEEMKKRAAQIRQAHAEENRTAR